MTVCLILSLSSLYFNSFNAWRKSDALWGNQYSRYWLQNVNQERISHPWLQVLYSSWSHNITLKFLAVMSYFYCAQFIFNEKPLNLYYVGCWKAFIIHFMDIFPFSSTEIFYLFNITFILFSHQNYLDIDDDNNILFQYVSLGVISAKWQTKSLQALISSQKHFLK